MSNTIKDKFKTFDEFNEDVRIAKPTNIDDSRDDARAEHEIADFSKDDEEFASNILIKAYKEIKELNDKQFKLRKEFFALSRKRDLVNKNKIQQELIKLHREITGLDHEFQRLLGLEEPNYNENI